jgi:hypothetical protein
VLLAFGYCGNSVAGLVTGSFELILPKVDDCVSLLLGSFQKRKKIPNDKHSVYLTEGWLNHESNMENEYEYLLKKYGEARARRIIDAMYAHHDQLSVIDTGAYNLDSILWRTEKLAEKFRLKHLVVPGTTEYIDKLLLGPWPANMFITLAPHSELSSDKLILP